MQVKVLKAFPYSPDGMQVIKLTAGEVVNIRDDLVEGLHSEGYIDEASADDVAAAQKGGVVITPPVEIPANWAELHWFKQRGIAAQLNGGVAPASKAAAVAMIEAELKARG